MTEETNIEAGLQIIINFIDREAGETLDNKERAIIKGCLAGLTYKEIKKDSAIFKNLTVEYIARYLAYKLWRKLNIVLEESTSINTNIKIKKNQLWSAIEAIANINNEQLPIDSLPPQLLEGKVLRNRYEITEYLFDRDATERHYQAIDRDFGNKACLVVQLVSGSQVIQNRFEREAAILSQLGNHSQIPQLLAYFTEERSYYLIYEYIEGEPLTNRFLENKPWEETEVISFLYDILSVLQFIHQQNLVHRNLNPDNLIQQSDGKVILVDFATVKPIDCNNSSTSFARGMKGYLPAEQLKGVMTPASDIYAIGNIVIHALTGIHPCKLKVDRATGNIIWRNLVQVNSSLADLIDRMVCYYFPQRYQTASEVLTILKHLYPLNNLNT